ncbi:hypothetical protein EVAR_77609_1 [Eumeta japonica]|uniref:Uncharacterized protein n=1 Tax=Eumeta variegata TaxID=151549 RepID=A0A4C1T9G9_EUMVA|nr:hypothetical protein EVAR_77609_1 [Eumeta japonica]
MNSWLCGNKRLTRERKWGKRQGLDGSERGTAPLIATTASGKTAKTKKNQNRANVVVSCARVRTWARTSLAAFTAVVGAAARPNKFRGEPRPAVNDRAIIGIQLISLGRSRSPPPPTPAQRLARRGAARARRGRGRRLMRSDGSTSHTSVSIARSNGENLSRPP